MLVITRRLGEAIVIGNDITLTVVDIRGDKVRLGVTCPAQIPIHRGEFHEAIHRFQPPPRSPEELAFLQAVLETPDDEGIRLIFADWLEEQDDPRGEFIRVQCRLAGLDVTGKERQALQAREYDLWVAHAQTWRAYLPPVLRSAPFERGFVESVHLSLGGFLAHARDIFAAAPIRRLHASRKEWYQDSSSLAALAASAFLANLAELELGGMGLADRNVVHLASSPHAASLLSLGLRDNSIGDEAASALAASPHLANLRQLDVTFNRIGQAGAEALRARFGERVLL
jgi:carbon storage regulator CsrA